MDVQKNVVVSAGPIPARLDSVKYITNMFKGGLALRTAEYLANCNHKVTLVVWDRLDNEKLKNPEWTGKMAEIVKVRDVYEYCAWFEENARDYDAFVMAAAVANLAPVGKITGKFPSHKYSVGQEFNIKFTIAPRAIDLIKKLNPRACLVGYKLFDPKSDQELIDAARHTLEDSKANLIFANTPAMAKIQKIALTQDGSIIPCTFDQHLRLIDRAIRQEYFRTEIVPMPPELENDHHVKTAMAAVEMFEKTFEKYGTVAIPLGHVRPGAFATTARGHSGEPVIVWNVDFRNRIIKATGKATLNAPALRALIDDQDRNKDRIIIHRHFTVPNPCDSPDGYVFPGTVQEAELAMSAAKHRSGPFDFKLREPFHGYTKPAPVLPVDWDKYRDQFPDRYFGIPDSMKSIIETYEDENRDGSVLELGCGTQPVIRSGYAYDPNITEYPVSDVMFLDSFEDVLDMVRSGKIGLVAMCNSLNYLSPDQLRSLAEALDATGTAFIANTFAEAPEKSVRDDEAAVLDPGSGRISHILRLPDDSLAVHGFYAYGYKYLERAGFQTEDYKEKSILVARNLIQFAKLPVPALTGIYSIRGYDKDHDAYHELACYNYKRDAWRAAYREWQPKIKNEDILAPSAEPFDWLVVTNLVTGETEVV